MKAIRKIATTAVVGILLGACDYRVTNEATQPPIEVKIVLVTMFERGADSGNLRGNNVHQSNSCQSSLSANPRLHKPHPG